MLLAGCATYVPSTQADAFDKSVKAAATNLQASLDEVQSVEVDNQVDIFVQGDDHTLEHLDLDPKLTDKLAKAITTQFSVLVSYADALKSVTTPGSAWGTSVSKVKSACDKVIADSGALAANMGKATLLTPASVTAITGHADSFSNAVSTAGQGLLTIYGEEKAFAVAHKVDPDLQSYCKDLEKILSQDSSSGASETGLAGILHANYERKISVLKIRFTSAPPARNPDDPNFLPALEWRSNLVKEFVALRKDEAAGEAKITALRKAVGDIAAAHSALANRNDAKFRDKLADADGLLESAIHGAPAPEGDAGTK